MVLSVPLGDVPELTVVIALGEPVGGDDRGDLLGVGKEANRGAHCVDVLWSDGYCNRGGEFALSGGGKDKDTSRISDRGSQGVKMVVRFAEKV